MNENQENTAAEPVEPSAAAEAPKKRRAPRKAAAEAQVADVAAADAPAPAVEEAPKKRRTSRKAAAEAVEPQQEAFGHQVKQEALVRRRRHELRVLGSRCGPFAPALELLRAGGVAVESMISRVFPLDEAERAFEAAALPENIKVLLQPA